MSGLLSLCFSKISEHILLVVLFYAELNDPLVEGLCNKVYSRCDQTADSDMKLRRSESLAR